MPKQKWTFGADQRWRAPGKDPLFARDALVYGSYRPDAGTTGHIGSLTPWSGNFTTSVPNQVIENLDISGRLIISKSGCIVRNCRIAGGIPNENSFGSIKAFDAVSPKTIIEDCTIYASVLSAGSGAGLKLASNGIQGRDFEIRRCNIYGSVDGIGAQNGNVTILGCWIHDLTWHAVDPAQTDGSHNDGIQLHGGGSGYLFRGNSIEMGANHNAAIMINGDFSNLTIDRNWLISTGEDLCATGINSGVGTRTSVTITNNKFSDLETWEANHAALIKPATYDIANISNNTYLSSGLPAKITRA